MRPARTSVRIPETQRAAQGRGGPTFRSLTPICDFFATSSDFSYAPHFPVKLGPDRAPIWPIYLCKADRLIIILFHYNYNIFFYKNQKIGAQPDR